MKYIFPIIILISSFGVKAQNSEEATTRAKKDSAEISRLVERLKISWQLGFQREELTRPNDERLLEFKNLFNSNATIDADVDAYYQDTKSIPYKLKVDTALTVDDYSGYLSNHFKSLKINIADTAIIRSDISNRDTIYLCTLFRTMFAEKKGNYIFGKYDIYSEINNISNSEVKSNSEDGLRKIELSFFKFNLTDTIEVAIVRDSVFHIKSIVRVGLYNLTCVNDADADAFISEIENCDMDFGPMSNSGCPLDSIFPPQIELDGYIGLQFNSCKLKLPGFDELGYNEMDVLQSKMGSISSEGLITSLAGGGDMTYYMGDKGKRKAGITLGFSFTSYNADYTVTEPLVYTYKSNDGENDYRRRITINEGFREHLAYNVFNIPLMFTYKWILKDINSDSRQRYDVDNYKWSFRLNLGPSLLMFRNSSEYNGQIDFEGMYQVDTVTQNSLTYYDYFDEGSSWNVLLTEDYINDIAAIPGAAAIFNVINNFGYDFASNKTFEGKAKNLNRITLGINANFDACYKINNMLSLKLGFNAMVAPMLNKSKSYIPVDKTTDTYNSLFNSNSNSLYMSYGLNAGVVFYLKN